MALTYADLLDVMIQRAERLGLVAPGEQKADAAELEIYLFYGLLTIVESIDIPDYLFYDDSIATTTPGISDYAMPDTYGRLIMTRVQNKRGIYIFNQLKNTDLEYLDPNSFSRKTSQVNAIPIQFTVMQRKLKLFPLPDTGTYVIRGTYVKRVERPDLDDDVMLSYPTAIVDTALLQLATDMGKQVPTLATSQQAAAMRLAAGSK